MRSTRDRIRHAILFEVIGLLLIVPLGTAAFGLHAADMGVIGVGSALVATSWNYVYNLGFDRAMQRLAGHTRKSVVLEHWSHAVAQGVHAGRLLAGAEPGAPYGALPTFWSTQGDLVV
ncbi:hypothetical protein OMR07_20300, partial [Methylobacterium organophilum]|nr:hypothetical protein [Methylobacterium organophilum]